MYMAKLCPQNKNVDINLRHMLDVLLELPSLGTPKRQNAGKPNIWKVFGNKKAKV